MNKKQFFKATLFGFLIWLIPFVLSLFFYDRDQQLVIDQTFFKSIMIVASTLSVMPLIIRYFTQLKDNYLRQGLLVGLWWLTINLALDVIVLLPWLKISFDEYIMQIGLRYLIMPIITFGVGYLLQKRR